MALVFASASCRGRGASAPDAAESPEPATTLDVREPTPKPSLHLGACALQTADGAGQTYTFRTYERGALGRLVSAYTFADAAEAKVGNERWRESWTTDASQVREHRLEWLGGLDDSFGGLPDLCSSGEIGGMPLDARDFEGWERWYGGEEALTYRASGIGLDHAQRCFTNRWESNPARGTYKVAARSSKSVRYGYPGCAWCFLEGVPAERFGLDGTPVMGAEECSEVRSGGTVIAQGPDFEETEYECLLDLVESTSRTASFVGVPGLDRLAFEGPPWWTQATLGAETVADVRWGDDGLPLEAQLPTCGATLTWRYDRDEEGRVVKEHREGPAGVDVWTMAWSSVHERPLSRMDYEGADGSRATIEFDPQGNLTRATLSAIAEQEDSVSRVSSDGAIVVDYGCGPAAPFTTGQGWIALLFELSVDPTVPEHNQLFPIPQFVYARLDSSEPLGAAGVWGTGRGAVSDLEITGRFSVPGCLPIERQP